MNFTVIEEERFELILKRIYKIEEALRRQLLAQERLYTVPETMKILNVSRKTLQSLRDHRKLSFVQFGRNILFKRSDIKDFLRRHHLKARF